MPVFLALLSYRAFFVCLNCSSREFVIVGDEMINYLIESEIEFNANGRTKSNHVVDFPEDETAAKIGAVIKSEEKKYFMATENEVRQVLDIISLPPPCLRRRLYFRLKTSLHIRQLENGRSTIKEVARLLLKK